MTRKGFRKVFYLLCLEGAFAMAYEAWIGVNYLSGLAGELQVPISQTSFLISVPWIGAIGQLVGVWALERINSPKGYTLRVAAAARTLWLIPLFFAAYWGWRAQSDGADFPRQAWILLLAAIACVSAIFATSSAAAWMSWMQEIVPSHFRGRFFGYRQRYTMAAIIVANLTAAFWVGWKPDGVFAGYWMLGMFAVVCGLVSVWLLSRVPDAPPMPGKGRDLKYVLKRLREPVMNPRFRKVLIFGALFNGAVQLTGPYFPYYFTKELGISMSSIAVWMVLAQVGGLVSASWWGRKIDSTGDAPRLIFWAGNMIAFAPLIYVFRGADAIRLLAPFDYAINGAAWTGYTLAFTTILMKVCPQGRSAVYFSVYTAAAGLAGAAGNYLGGQLAQWLEPWGGFRALFVVGGCLRFLLIWSLYGLIRDAVLLRKKHAATELDTSADQTGNQPATDAVG